MTEVSVVVSNELGLHLRAAARFVDVAGRFRARVTVATTGPAVDGRSLLALSSLLARRGSTLHIRCEGPDEGPAAEALVALVQAGFPDNGRA